MQNLFEFCLKHTLSEGDLIARQKTKRRRQSRGMPSPAKVFANEQAMAGEMPVFSFTEASSNAFVAIRQLIHAEKPLLELISSEFWLNLYMITHRRVVVPCICYIHNILQTNELSIKQAVLASF